VTVGYKKSEANRTKNARLGLKQSIKNVQFAFFTFFKFSPLPLSFFYTYLRLINKKRNNIKREECSSLSTPKKKLENLITAYNLEPDLYLFLLNIK